MALSREKQQEIDAAFKEVLAENPRTTIRSLAHEGFTMLTVFVNDERRKSFLSQDKCNEWLKRNELADFDEEGTRKLRPGVKVNTHLHAGTAKLGAKARGGAQ